MTTKLDAPDTREPAWRPIAEKLQVMGSDAARVARVVHDERFQRWLSHVLEEPRLHVGLAAVGPPVWMLQLRADQGLLRLAVPEAEFTPALRMALALPHREAACQVANLLLAPTFDRFSPLLTGLALQGAERVVQARAGFRVSAAGRKAWLCGADPALPAQIAPLLREIPAAVEEWGALRMRARLRLMVRDWTADVLASLRPGDVAVIGRRQDKHILIVGTGFSMQAPARISMDEDEAQIVGDPYMASDEPYMSDAPGADVEAIELPVAFEIDTARLSLAELAGIRPGYVIELDTPVAEAAVRLLCQGQVIGTGQLIAVGEQLGVRISRMGLSDGFASSR